MNLPVEDASFDVVLCSQVLEHCDDRAVSELRRVTAPGGRVLATTHGVMPYHPSPTTGAGRMRGSRSSSSEPRWESVRVTPSSGTTCLGMLISIALDLAFRRIRLGFAAKPIVAAINTVAMGIDGRSTSLRAPGPSGLFANFHVVAEAAMKALVTGGGGFIGSNVVALLARGDDVRVLDNFSTGSRANLAGLEHDVSSSRATCARTSACTQPFEGPRSSSTRVRCRRSPLRPGSAHHDGGQHRGHAERPPRGPRRGRATHRQRVVLVRLRERHAPAVETQAPDPISPYAVAKLAAERFCTSFSRVYGMEIVSLRYFNVFGPRQDPTSQYAAVVPRFIRAIADGEPVTIYGDGDQSRDFTFVDNVVGANLLAADAPGVGGEILNVATGESVTVNALADAIGAMLDEAVEKAYEPAEADVRASWADVGEARAPARLRDTGGLRRGPTPDRRLS